MLRLLVHVGQRSAGGQQRECGRGFVYHAANVVDGLFTYAGGSYKNRYTSCQVSWSDPSNHYSDTIEGVYDSDLVNRYGVNETQLTAIGCTSQSEAHRRGRWVILSSAKDGTISRYRLKSSVWLTRSGPVSKTAAASV